MKRSPRLAVCLLAALYIELPATAQNTLAQSTASAHDPQAGVVLTKLSLPVYPPLAHYARIMGDVKLHVHVRKDGSVESLELFTGHPFLAPAALESARNSRFECRGCVDEVTSYPMTYTFGLLDDGKPKEVVTERPARSAKCLFLWRCGIEHTTTWQCPDTRAPETTESDGHVTVLVSTVCSETERSY
jgi:hypothetical protein